MNHLLKPRLPGTRPVRRYSRRRRTVAALAVFVLGQFCPDRVNDVRLGHCVHGRGLRVRRRQPDDTSTCEGGLERLRADHLGRRCAVPDVQQERSRVGVHRAGGRCRPKQRHCLRRRNQAGQRLRDCGRREGAEQGRPRSGSTSTSNHRGGDVFLGLSWWGIPQNTTSPSAHIGFEFNKGTTACPTGLGTASARCTVGDMLVVYDFEGGATDVPDDHPAALGGGTGTCEVSNSSPPCWGPATDLTALGFAEAEGEHHSGLGLGRDRATSTGYHR